ncbi:MAG: transcription termination/antitermination protein NusA, partial [Planctomycetes bacterium]|nr:transcription termination/antitermination protein NusA [Planctomycetota bacterium]
MCLDGWGLVPRIFLIGRPDMRGKEILRLVDGLHRNKDIDAEIIFKAIESALESAARKHFGSSEDVSVDIDRETGEVEAYIEGERVEPEELGRIAAQTAKQIITQRIRQAESEIIYEEYTEKKGQLVTGTVQRFDGGATIINLEKTEAVLPRSEQIPGEHYQPGERIRGIVLDVRKSGEQAKIILSRTHPDLIKRLFDIEVPEVGEGVVVVRRIAREPGQRTKIAMESLEPHVDCIGACVGVRGTRIKSIIDELSGEKIDIIPWREAPEILIADSLKPAEILQMTLEEGEGTKHATVVVPEDQLALAIGRKGQNVRLAVKLTGWDIDIQPPGALEEEETERKEEEEMEELPEEPEAPEEKEPEETEAAEGEAAPVEDEVLEEPEVE